MLPQEAILRSSLNKQFIQSDALRKYIGGIGLEA